MEKKEEIISVKVEEVDIESTTESVYEKAQVYTQCLEVEAATVIEDDETMPAETFRAYVIGVLLTVLAAIISNVTELRAQPLVIQPTVIQLLAFPIGRAWARWMPTAKVRVGTWSLSLNPGAFTVKEHTLISMMANVGAGWPPYAIGLIIAQIKKYSNFFLLSLR
jgi:OPT oligopeptide transporter protein